MPGAIQRLGIQAVVHTATGSLPQNEKLLRPVRLGPCHSYPWKHTFCCKFSLGWTVAAQSVSFGPKSGHRVLWFPPCVLARTKCVSLCQGEQCGHKRQNAIQLWCFTQPVVLCFVLFRANLRACGNSVDVPVWFFAVYLMIVFCDLEELDLYDKSY